MTTPCQGAVIEMTLPGPITPAGLKLIEQGYTVVPVTGDVVAKSENFVENSADGARVQRYRFTMKDPLPAGTSDRIQIPWHYNGNDAPRRPRSAWWWSCSAHRYRCSATGSECGPTCRRAADPSG